MVSVPRPPSPGPGPNPRATADAGAARGAWSRLHPAAALRRRWRAWWNARLQSTDALTLTQRNVYILPTGPGWMYALTLVVLLLASINYQLSLGYLLTFLLAGCGLASMHVAHNTLRGLHLHLSPPAPVFAGRAALLEVTVSHTRPRPRYGIGLAVLPEDRGTAVWSWTDVLPQGHASVHIGFQPVQRGWHGVPLLTAETRFPLGLFRVWTFWRPAARVLVYPHPEQDPPALPRPQPAAGGSAPMRTSAGDELEGVRSYRRGDPLKWVVWKKAAKTDELVSRDTVAAQQQQLWLDFAAAGALDRERRLSRLTAWVLAADRHGLQYGLRLPGLEVESDVGDAHRRRCLEALALWQ